MDGAHVGPHFIIIYPKRSEEWLDNRLDVPIRWTDVLRDRIADRVMLRLRITTSKILLQSSTHLWFFPLLIQVSI